MPSTKKLAKYIVENSYHDRESNTLFVANPGISYETIKNLAKKYNFTVTQIEDGNVVSVPTKYKYTEFDTKSISLYDDFTDTYTLYDKNYDTLLTAYKTFDLMDENLSEIGLILDTYAAEVLSQGFVSNPLKIKISNQKAQQLIERVFYKNKIYQNLPDIVRAIAKYGNYGMILSYPYLEEWMNKEKTDDDRSIDFSAIDIVEDLNISFINPKYFKVNCDEYYNPINYETQVENTFVSKNSVSMLNHRVWQPWQFCHFLIPSEITKPYGKSMLWSMRSAFDQLTTLEALLGISRASNIQRLVFYVPLPNGINIVDAYGYMNEFKTQYLNSVFTDQGTVKGGRKIPGAMSILTLPESHDGKRVSVDHIEAKIDLSSTEDVEYFLDKILRSSALPKGYLVGEDVITTSQTLEAQDLKLRRTLIPLRQALLNGIMTLIDNVLTHAGFDVTKLDISVGINEPVQVTADTIQKYSDINELLKSCLEINPQMPNINKFQFLVKMGMPTDVASLVCSSAAINTLPIPEDLGNFLLGKTVKPKGMVQNNPEMEESVAASLTSQVFLKESTDFINTLTRFKNTYLTATDRSLKESLLTSSKAVLKESN